MIQFYSTTAILTHTFISHIQINTSRKVKKLIAVTH